MMKEDINKEYIKGFARRGIRLGNDFVSSLGHLGGGQVL